MSRPGAWNAARALKTLVLEAGSAVPHGSHGQWMVVVVVVVVVGGSGGT